ncbi:MAG: hypothetical protein ACJ748_02425 [Flavisolibacter sp.]
MSSKIQSKLMQYEATPPPGAWNKITAALDEDATASYKDKLYDFEELPPVQIWNKIKDQLASHTPAKVIPFFKRYSRPLKYFGAAGLIIFIAVSFALLLGKRTGSEETVDNVTNKTQPALNSIVPSIENNSVTPSVKQFSFIKSRSSKNNNQVRRSIYNIGTHLLNSGILMNSFFPEMAVQKQSDEDYNSYSDKFMVYSDDDGNATRLPKKVYDLFACKQADNNCRERIKNLQQKIANSAFASDFSGILDMLHNLQDNQ